MRFDVKKYLFVGLEIEREAFFKKAQQAGMIHFIDQDKLTLKQFPDELNAMKQALRILNSYPLIEQKQPDELNPEHLVEKITHHKAKIDSLLEERRTLNLEISRIEALGDFSMEDIAILEKEGKRIVQFFFAKQGSYVLENLPPEMIYINRSHGLDYFISISSQKIDVSNFIEMRVEKSIRELKKRLVEAAQELDIEEASLKSNCKYKEWLHQVLVSELNHYHLKQTKESAQAKADDKIFVIEGWVPTNKISELENLAINSHLHVEEIAIEQNDRIPTYLENEGIHKIGEDVVEIYDTPSSSDKDPSLWVLLSFAFFFAFIVGDAGYGLVFLLTAFYLRYQFPDLKGLNKRMLKLLALLSVSCIIWGSFTASFFGISFAPNSAVRKVSVIHWLIKEKTQYHIIHKDNTYQYWINKYPALIQIDNPEQFIENAVTVDNGKTNYDLLNRFSDGILLELSLLIGVIHLIVSMLRYIGRNPVNSGWIFVIIGATLYIPYYLETTSLLQFLFYYDQANAAQFGLYLIYTGMGIAVGISLIKNKLLGLLEVMTAIQIFSDLLSYLRLYALALAGAIVTSVINDAVALMPFILGVGFFVLAHAVNIILAIQGGVIHGLRLNFLEWYHYSFEGGGKKFKPLKLLQTE